MFFLPDELEALENLHSWRCVRLTPDAVELVYASRYHVTVPCARFKPIPPRVTVQKVKDFLSKDRDAFPQLAQLMLDGVPYVLKRCNTETTLPEVSQIVPISGMLCLLVDSSSKLWAIFGVHACSSGLSLRS